MPKVARKITPKQAKLAEIVIEEGKKVGKRKTKSKMLEESGYSRSTIQKHTERPFNTQGFLDALADRGVTQDRIAKVFEEATGANIVSVYRGKVTETSVPDHKIRLQSASLLGDFTGQKKVNIQQVNVNVGISDEDARAFLGLG